MRISQSRFILLFCCVLFIIGGCAKTGNLTGGPKDKKPPSIVAEKSTLNYSTNFDEKQIVVVFDEFIELKNLDKNLLISPPLKYNPDIRQRGKKVTIKIDKDEVLRDDATYSIDLGNSVVDYTEGNAFEKLKYVFATGDEIDSLKLRGSIRDAYNSEEELENMYILLYDDLRDSIIAQERPFYIVKADEEGNFLFENLKAGIFRIFALGDKNFNFKWEPESEQLGFLNTLIAISDTIVQSVNINVFAIEQEQSLVSTNRKIYGKVQHTFTKMVDSLMIVDLLYPRDLEFQSESSNDTLTLWYDAAVDSFEYIVLEDTVKVFPAERNEKFTESKLKFYAAQSGFAPWENPQINTTSPIMLFDTSAMRLFESITPAPKQTSKTENPSSLERRGGQPSLDRNRGRSGIGSDSPKAEGENPAISDSSDLAQRQDSTEVIEKTSVDTTIMDTAIILEDSIQLDSIPLDSILLDSLQVDTVELPIDTAFVSFDATSDLRTIELRADLKDGQAYTMLLYPGAVVDIYGRTNDTAVVTFVKKDSLNYGSINLSITELVDSLDYIVQLRKEDKTLSSVRVEKMSTDSIFWTQMPLSTYNLLVIEDLDGDGEWTTGDYWLKRQPEKLKRYKLEKMQQGFDLQADISWTAEKKIEVAPPDSTTTTTPKVERPPSPSPTNNRSRGNNRE